MLIQPELYLSAGVTTRHKCTQEDLLTVVGNSRAHAPSRGRHLEKNRQEAKEECYPGEIELENEGSNENSRLI